MVVTLLTYSGDSISRRGEWIKLNGEYEEGIFTLEIAENMYFSIEIYSTVYNEIVGLLEGRLEEIESLSHPGVNFYYAIFKKYKGAYDRSRESCIILLKEIDNNIIVEVFGDNVNTEFYSYNGIYIKNEILNNNGEQKLKSIFYDYYDIETIKNLLGLNIKYFLEIFDSTKIENFNEIIIIKGWVPGGNRWTNGIVKIEGKYIYILFADFRIGMLKFMYFSNDTRSQELPPEFYEWDYFPKASDIEIRKIIK
jgi:hypothetical protein